MASKLRQGFLSSDWFVISFAIGFGEISDWLES